MVANARKLKRNLDSEHLFRVPALKERQHEGLLDCLWKCAIRWARLRTHKWAATIQSNWHFGLPFGGSTASAEEAPVCEPSSDTFLVQSFHLCFSHLHRSRSVFSRWKCAQLLKDMRLRSVWSADFFMMQDKNELVQCVWWTLQKFVFLTFTPEQPHWKGEMCLFQKHRRCNFIWICVKHDRKRCGEGKEKEQD